MRVRVEPGTVLREARPVAVPGDKSIAHRWLILAATARGRSRLEGLPTSLDVRSTARSLSMLAPACRSALEGWLDRAERGLQGEGELTLDGAGREALVEPEGPLDCGNSGTTMRLLAGLVAAAPFRTVLDGDESLRRRPMDRVASPLRQMGARVETADARPPLSVWGGPLRGIRYALPVPSAQLKSAILLAGLASDGETTVEETVPTRDHTERALAALDGPVRRHGSVGEYRRHPEREAFRAFVSVSAFQHEGFDGAVPGDPSAAAFLAAAAAVAGGAVEVAGVGLNPTRTGFLRALAAMGVEEEEETGRWSMGEPAGTIRVAAGAGPRGVTVRPWELPLVIDEVPALAAVAAHAAGESRFEGAGELRVKESDRLAGLAEGLRGLGGEAAVEGDALVLGGGGLGGGRADARGDHRLAMALAVAALGARGPCEVAGMEWAEVSFPGFVQALAALGARVEVVE